MTMYKINAVLDVPSGQDTDGYSVYDFFTTDILALHSTPEAAQRVAEAGYRGRDQFGAGAVWEVVEVIL
jgi:hypothetical protein